MVGIGTSMEIAFELRPKRQELGRNISASGEAIVYSVHILPGISKNSSVVIDTLSFLCLFITGSRRIQKWLPPKKAISIKKVYSSLPNILKTACFYSVLWLLCYLNSIYFLSLHKICTITIADLVPILVERTRFCVSYTSSTRFFKTNPNFISSTSIKAKHKHDINCNFSLIWVMKDSKMVADLLSRNFFICAVYH